MKGSVILGKIKGIQIEVNLSWLIVFGLITYMLATSYFPENYPGWQPIVRWLLGSVVALLFFASVLLHELSHSLVSISMGLPVKKITLFIFGGVAQIDKEPDQPIKELKIAIAGPVMSLLISAVCQILAGTLAVSGAPQVAIMPFSYIASVNLVLALFNLVPAFPLDGGRVLRALIWYFSGNLQTATRFASFMGGSFGYLLIIGGIYTALSGYFVNGIWFIFIGWFVQQASQTSYQYTLMSDIFNKIQVREFMTDQVTVVEDHLSIQDLVEGYFYKYKFASFPVRRDAEVIGLVTLDSIKKISRNAWSQATVASITLPLEDALMVAPGDTVATAMSKLFSNGVGRVLVLEDGKLLGIVSRTDLLNYIHINSLLGQ